MTIQNTTTTLVVLYDSSEYDDCCGEVAQEELEDVLDELDANQLGINIEISGSLGLWNGRHKIEPVQEPDFTSAVRRCIGRDADRVKIERGDGFYVVSVYHHDGVNEFRLID